MKSEIFAPSLPATCMRCATSFWLPRCCHDFWGGLILRPAFRTTEHSPNSYSRDVANITTRGEGVGSAHHRLLHEVHIPFAIDRDKVTCALVTGPRLVNHFCGHVGETSRA